jgi:hypothetical protein
VDAVKIDRTIVRIVFRLGWKLVAAHGFPVRRLPRSSKRKPCLGGV